MLCNDKIGSKSKIEVGTSPSIVLHAKCMDII